MSAPMSHQAASAAVAAAWAMPTASDTGGREYWTLAHARHNALAVAYDALLPHMSIGSGEYYAVVQAVGMAEERRDHAAERAGLAQGVAR